MPFGPSKPFSLSLKQATPTPFDVPHLRAQMENVGLSCAALTDDALAGYITTVQSQMPGGSSVGWSIVNAVDHETLTAVATATWEPTNNAQGYNTILSSLVYPEFFDWINQNAQQYSFPGVVNAVPESTQLLPNAQSVTEFFIKTAQAASGTMVKGINPDDMAAAFTNIISSVDPQMVDYDSGAQNRIIYMVENYNPSTGEADGIGAVRIDWHLTIADYKRKSKDGGDTHKVTMSLTARGVFYVDNTVCENYTTIYNQFQSQFKYPKQACPVPSS